VSNKLEKQSCESECITEDRTENIIKELAAVTVEFLNQLNHSTGRNIQYFQHISEQPVLRTNNLRYMSNDLHTSD